jgi:hypothetical protein
MVRNAGNCRDTGGEFGLYRKIPAQTKLGDAAIGEFAA